MGSRPVGMCHSLWTRDDLKRKTRKPTRRPCGKRIGGSGSWLSCNRTKPTSSSGFSKIQSERDEPAGAAESSRTPQWLTTLQDALSTAWVCSRPAFSTLSTDFGLFLPAGSSSDSGMWNVRIVRTRYRVKERARQLDVHGCLRPPQ